MNIWCLFSVENNYDQPQNNLVAWWPSKLTMDILSTVLEIPFKGDENVLNIVHVYQGQVERIGETDYRLEEISAGKL